MGHLSGPGNQGIGSFPGMSERDVQAGLNVNWEPNAPEAVLVSNDLARTVSAARAHMDDADQRNVVLGVLTCQPLPEPSLPNRPSRSH